MHAGYGAEGVVDPPAVIGSGDAIFGDDYRRAFGDVPSMADGDAQRRREVLPAGEGAFRVLGDRYGAILADEGPQIGLHPNEVIPGRGLGEVVLARVLVFLHLPFASGHGVERLAGDGPPGLDTRVLGQYFPGFPVRFVPPLGGAASCAPDISGRACVFDTFGVFHKFHGRTFVQAPSCSSYVPLSLFRTGLPHLAALKRLSLLSGLMNAAAIALNALPQEQYESLYEKIDAEILTEYKNASEHYKKYEGALDAVSSFFNDLFLKSNGVPSGTKSYSQTTRGLIGFRGDFMTATKGNGVINTIFDEYLPYKGDMNYRSQGSLIAYETGTSITYGLFNAQERGTLFIGPGEPVYAGMVIGENGRTDDIEVNVCKKKQLTNTRSSGADDALKLTPPKVLSLEQALDFIDTDELLEITPKSFRIRKKILDPTLRFRAKRDAGNK